MNYLAHAYLSFHDPEITTGNLISDFVKGKKKLDFIPGIQRGIALHRAIDNFTDSHPVVRESKVIFKPAYGPYSGALIDISFDYFLANDPRAFPPQPGEDHQTGSPAELARFSHKVYDQIATFRDVFPAGFAQMFPYMQRQDWLYNYRFIQGIQNSFAGLARRASYMPPADAAAGIFTDNLQVLQQHYDNFFPELREYAANTLNELKDKDNNI